MAHARPKMDFSCRLETAGREAVLSLGGRMDARTAAKSWNDVRKTIQTITADSLEIDLSQVSYMDTAGAHFLGRIEKTAADIGIAVPRISRLSPAYLKLFELSRQAMMDSPEDDRPAPLSFVESYGKWLADTLSGTHEFVTYIGQIAWALAKSLRNPGRIRWADAMAVAERAGVNALPIVALISFIVGLVMAFQAAIPMRMFGAELYVSNLIGIAMVRELGPLMTAIVLAGRSASAFAAEIGTMRINEEIDALTVMGIDPVQFLIVPRVIASTIMTPLLTIFANLMGILGGALVITSMGYPMVSYYNQIAAFVQLNDLIGGMIKCLVFGILIAVTGCIRGYQTQSGPSAVGESTTRAVVTGIILIAVFDALFSIIYYYLGI